MTPSRKTHAPKSKRKEQDKLDYRKQERQMKTEVRRRKRDDDEFSFNQIDVSPSRNSTVQATQKNMNITNVCVDHPCIIMGIGLIILLICFFFAIDGKYYFQNKPDDRDLLVWNDKIVKEWNKQEAGRIATRGA